MIQTTTIRPRRVTKTVITKRDNKSPATSAGRNRRRRRRNRRGRNQLQQSPMNDQILAVCNPCHGPISRLIGNGAITERVRATTSMPNTAANISGYAVWFPSYHNGGASYFTSNCFIWESPNSGTAPTNTLASPLGMGAISTTGFAYPDPAYTTAAGVAFSRAKTHSACLQVDYVGKLSDVSGQVAIVKNFPLKGFFSNKTTTTLAAPSVDDVFAFAAERERIQVTGHEVVWRPTDESSVFRTTGNDRQTTGVSPDSGWTNGIIATGPSTFSSSDFEEMYGICVAWKGLPATAGVLSINFIKVISLELAPSGNQIESPVVTSSASIVNPMATVTAWLDRNKPGWQTNAINTTMNVSGALAKAYAPKAISYFTSGLRGRSNLLTNY